VEQTAVYECKRLGDRKLCNATRGFFFVLIILYSLYLEYDINAMHCESISRSPTLVDNRDVLEHRNAAKQHLVHSIGGTHKGDLERGMLKQWPTLNITRSKWYQVRPQVDMVKSHSIQSAWDNIAELYDLYRFESNAEHLQFIDSLPADNEDLFPLAERVEAGVCSPN